METIIIICKYIKFVPSKESNLPLAARQPLFASSVLDFLLPTFSISMMAALHILPSDSPGTLLAFSNFFHGISASGCAVAVVLIFLLWKLLFPQRRPPVYGATWLSSTSTRTKLDFYLFGSPFVGIVVFGGGLMPVKGFFLNGYSS